MKDTIITAKRKKTELIMLLFCFLLANAGNLYAIITYQTSFIELLTSLGYVCVATIVLYAIWAFIRLCFWSVKFLIKKRSN